MRLAVVALTLFVPRLASAALCSPCSASVTCTGNEVCASGLPENDGMNGRCVSPCPNLNAPFGGCPTNYTCTPFGDAVRYCVPRSDDCTQLGSYSERQLGQSCTSQSCVSNALCLDGVCTAMCSGPGASCPGGQTCGFIGLPVSPIYLCGHMVGEGAVCGSGDLCSVGLCLNDGTSTLCYRNCGAGQPTFSCAGGQTCDNISLNGGDSVDLCMPPQMGSADAGVPSFPDAFVPNPDAFVPTFPDAFVPSPDAFVPTFPDAFVPPGLDASVPGGEDARVVGAREDASSGPHPDATITRAGGGGGAVTRRSSGCASTQGDGALAGLFVLAALALARRR